MLHPNALRSVIAMVLTATPILAADVTDAPRKQYALPMPKETPVIVLDYKGGFTPPRENDEPAVLIRADGTVILGAPFGQQKRIETKITADEIQELLHFALATQRLADFDAAKVQQEMRASGPLIAIADAATTVIRIHADGKIHEAEFYALGMMARQFPKIQALSQLEAVRKRLERLRAEINAGGNEGIAKHLTLVNARLKADHPDVPPLTAKDLQSAWQRANGGAYVSFQRSDKLGEDKTQFISANINYPAGGEPKVTVHANVVVRD